MIIGGVYSFNHGQKFLEDNYINELHEVEEIIKNINAEKHKIKKSKEKTMLDKILYSPKGLNDDFKNKFGSQGWIKKRVKCKYQDYNYYVSDFNPPATSEKQLPYREMDFLKNEIGVEVQFGKYAFMAYNVCAKMTIFRNLGYIKTGIEVVPLKQFADEMSTGVSYFEQIVWDLETRGVADIDVPVLVLGITA